MPNTKKPDRDRFVEKHATPIGGVPTRIDSDTKWAEDTDSHEVPHDVDVDTPVGLDTLDAQANLRLRARVKETLSTTKSVRDTVESTGMGLDTLRMETKRDVLRLETKIGLVNEKVGKLDEKFDQKVDKLGEKIDKHSELMMRELVTSRDQQRQHEVITFGARVDIDKAQKVTEIRDEGDAKKQKRSFMYAVGKTVLKILGGALAALAVAAATLGIERC